MDELTLVMIKDPQTMFAALKTGEIDAAARSLPPEWVKEWQTDPAIKSASAPSLRGTWLDINLKRAPFDNPDLRQAISLAVNTEPMLERIMLGMGKSGKHGWPHVASFWTSPDLSVDCDAARANEVMGAQGGPVRGTCRSGLDLRFLEPMSKCFPFKYFKTSPEVNKLAVMYYVYYVRFPLLVRYMRS